MKKLSLLVLSLLALNLAAAQDYVLKNLIDRFSISQGTQGINILGNDIKDNLGNYFLKGNSALFPDGIVSGCGLTISGSNVIVASGIWRISGVVYTKSTATTLAIDAQDATLSRYDVIYVDNTTNVHIVSGTLSATPVYPAIPGGTILLGAVLITPTSVTAVQPFITGFVDLTTNQTVAGNKTFTGVLTINGPLAINSVGNTASTSPGTAFTFGGVTYFYRPAGFTEGATFDSTANHPVIFRNDVSNWRIQNLDQSTSTALMFYDLGGSTQFYFNRSAGGGSIGDGGGNYYLKLGSSLLGASYTNANITISPTGQITAISNGTSGGYIPYTGATADVDLGTKNLNANTIGFSLIGGTTAYINGEVHLTAPAGYINFEPGATDKVWSIGLAGKQGFDFQLDGNNANIRTFEYYHSDDRLHFHANGTLFGAPYDRTIAYLSDITAATSGVVKNHTIFTPTSGGTVNLVNNEENIVNPAGTLASLTLTLPSSPANNDVINLTFTQAITSISYSGGTVVGSPSSSALGGQWHLTYDSGTSTWY